MTSLVACRTHFVFNESLGGFMAQISFRKYQPIGLRFWHWFNAVVILGLLGTVVLRKTFLSWRSNAALIEAKSQAAGTAISADLAKQIAVNLRDNMWDWHIYLGFALGALLLMRILVGIFIVRKCPANYALSKIWSLQQVAPEDKGKALHYAFVKTGYALFYLATLLMVVSGFLLNFAEPLALAKNMTEFLKEAHELLMWFFVIFVAGHILGVVVAENSDDPGLVSDMIHGGKNS